MLTVRMDFYENISFEYDNAQQLRSKYKYLKKKNYIFYYLTTVDNHPIT